MLRKLRERKLTKTIIHYMQKKAKKENLCTKVK